MLSHLGQRRSSGSFARGSGQVPTSMVAAQLSRASRVSDASLPARPPSRSPSLRYSTCLRLGALYFGSRALVTLGNYFPWIAARRTVSPVADTTRRARSTDAR